MAGFVNYFYKDGETPSNTKSTFTKHKILTIQNVIAKNTLLFMYKVNRFRSELPNSVRETIAINAPTVGSTYETCADWLESFNNNIYRNSIFFKGPLLFAEFAATNEYCNLSFCTPSLKNRIKNKLRDIQSDGDPSEWQSSNQLLYNIKGLRQSERAGKLEINFAE